MRTEQPNTVEPEKKLYEPAFMSYALHLMLQSMEDITFRGEMMEF